MTITYEHNGGGSNSDCTPAVSFNFIAPLSRTDSSQLNTVIPSSSTDRITHSWTTPTNEPNSADWPNSDYRGKCQVLTADACDITTKIQLLRVNSSCTLQETLGTSSAHAGTGNFNDVFSVDPSAGASGDRYQQRLLISNSNAHMDLSYATLSQDSLSEMIWDEAAPAGFVHSFGTIIG